MKTVLGFVGLPGGGKSTAIEIAKKFAPVVVMGDVVREEAKQRDLAITSANFGQIAVDLREKYGKMIIAERCISQIQSLSAKTIIVDGLRSMDEVKLFKKHFHVIIIAICVSETKRHAWLQIRNRDDDSSSMDLIKKRDEREKQFGVQTVIDHADYNIKNDSSIESLQQKIQILLETIVQND